MTKKRRAFETEEGYSTLIERDLSALAKDGKLPIGHGLDKEVAEVASLLGQGGKAPLLAGELGVGKSAIVQELARWISQGLLLPPLPNARTVDNLLVKLRRALEDDTDKPRWLVTVHGAGYKLDVPRDAVRWTGGAR